MASPSPTVAVLKRAARQRMSAYLASLSPSVAVQQSSVISSWVLKHPSWKEAAAVSLYLSLPGVEVQTDDLVRAAFAQGKGVYVPFCDLTRKGHMRMLRLGHIVDFFAMQPNKWGIREPTAYDAQFMPDAMEATPPLGLVLVPGLAFDRTGGRLGHGRGYYDRFLAACQERADRDGTRPPVTIALALKEQILPVGEQVPTNENDKKPDLIVTAEGPLVLQ